MITSEVHIPVTSPARVIAELDHKLQLLAEGGGYGNASEIQQLKAERRRWRKEANEIRRQRAEHHAHMARVHRRIAEDHHRRLVQLQREAELVEEVSNGEEELSKNGTH